MSIDGIGKKGSVPLRGTTEVAAGNPLSSAAKIRGDAFEISAAQAAATAASPEFDQVRAGRMPLETYLDHKVAQATAGLEGLPETELAFIKKTLRAELATDPALADLIKQATGAIPSLGDMRDMGEE